MCVHVFTDYILKVIIFVTSVIFVPPSMLLFFGLLALEWVRCFRLINVQSCLCCLVLDILVGTNLSTAEDIADLNWVKASSIDVMAFCSKADSKDDNCCLKPCAYINMNTKNK